ncbi:MAG: YkgJ family cysteine cluster protein [Thermodesulfobacteriota bacterium]
MDVNEPKAAIEPVRLDKKSRFRFRCHKEVACFTKCCRGINIVLTPYDIIRLKNRLGMTSTEFLAVFTVPRLFEKTDLPVVTLKLLDDELSSCPFVKDDGCMVYQDRPTTCRYYPLGVASLSHKEGADGDEFYFFVNEPHCRGFEEEKEWDVAEWRVDQGVDRHDEINAGWTDLVVRKRSFPPNIKLTEKTKQMFFTTCYDIDQFKHFVFESTFLSRYDIDPDQVERMRTDETALLEFGCKWMLWVLFKIGDFRLKEGGVKLDGES